MAVLNTMQTWYLYGGEEIDDKNKINRLCIDGEGIAADNLLPVFTATKLFSRVH